MCAPKPVAITVIFTLPFSVGSTTAPKMMLASSSRRLLHDRRRLAHLDERQVRAAGDVDDHAARAVHRRALEQRARNRAPRRLDRAVLPFGDAGAHHRQAHARHDRLHVGEVEVDQPGHENQIRNPLNRLPQHVVGRRERVGQRRRAIDDRQQPLVGNRDDRVDAVAQRLEAALGLQLALLALELERLGDDRDVSAPSSLARLAMTGAAPVPVPPPRPVVTKIMSAPSSAWMIFSVSSSAA